MHRDNLCCYLVGSFDKSITLWVVAGGNHFGNTDDITDFFHKFWSEIASSVSQKTSLGSLSKYYIIQETLSIDTCFNWRYYHGFNVFFK